MHTAPDTNPGMEPLLSTAAVAAWLGMSREQVWRLWRTGRLPGYHLDRHLRFARSDVEALLAAHRSGTAPADALPGVVLPFDAKQRHRRTRPEEYRRI